MQLREIPHQNAEADELPPKGLDVRAWTHAEQVKTNINQAGEDDVVPQVNNLQQHGRKC
jgi:hypothetical protein